MPSDFDMQLSSNEGYQHLLQQISDTYTQGRVQAVQAVNTHITQTYWQVGRHIVEFEQGGKSRADYGKALVANLANDLGLRHGKGFSRSNLVYMRLLYQRYPISQKPSHQLGWYLGYFASEENTKGDNPPIGIILTRNKDELLVEYATYQMNSQLFVQKYQLYLPEREELRREMELTLREAQG